VVQDPPTTVAGSVAQRSYTGPTIGDGSDVDTEDTSAEVMAEQQRSQDATDITNAGIALTVQGINGP
jgi:hypothetical protein